MKIHWLKNICVGYCLLMIVSCQFSENKSSKKKEGATASNPNTQYQSPKYTENKPYERGKNKEEKPQKHSSFHQERWHAPSLDKYPVKVPPIVISEWLMGHWTIPIAPQGVAPSEWPEVEKSLHPESCGKCHVQQYQDWKQSRHHLAMGPGVLGQLLDMEEDAPHLAMTCQRCHTPLYEQTPYLRKGVPNPEFDKTLRGKGLVCAACHVRKHVRHGPGNKEASSNGPHGGFVPREEYKDPAFCSMCHDFPPDGQASHGKLIQETGEEWRRTEFASQGQTCQSCHMPGGRHLWKGIHDKPMVEKALSVSMDSAKQTLTITNIGAGHRVPTYTIPQIVLSLEQLDSAGKVIVNTKQQGFVGRFISLETNQEEFDTRLMPGESYTLTYKKSFHPNAVRVRASVEVWPDEWYRQYFKKMAETPHLRPRYGVELIREAQSNALESRFLLWENFWSI